MKRLVDKKGRRVNYLRISVIPLCNMKCIYCYKEKVVLNKERMMSPSEIGKIVEIFSNLDEVKIRLTGGEPLLRNDIVDIVREIISRGINSLFITTNGALLKKYAFPLKEAGLKRINVSLDSLKEKNFERITGGGKLQEVLDGIEEAKKAGFESIKINVVLLRGINDDEIWDFISFAESNGFVLRFIEVMPVGLKNWERYFISQDEVFKKLSSAIDWKAPNVIDGPARYYKLKNGFEIGFISPISHNFCERCSRLRITYDGYLRACLLGGKEYDILSLLREGKEEEVISVIKGAISEKPAKGISAEVSSGRRMVEIGG